MKGKKLLTILLCIILLGTLLPASVFASEDVGTGTESAVSATESAVSDDPDESNKAPGQTEEKAAEEPALETIKTNSEESGDKKTDPDGTQNVVPEVNSDEAAPMNSGSEVPDKDTDENDSATDGEPDTEPAEEVGKTPVAEPMTTPAKEAPMEEIIDLAEVPSTEEVTSITFTVTFDANGHGTAPAAVSAAKEAVITEPASPSEDGYTFTGWYKDKETTELWDFSKDKVTEDITLYAGWTEEKPVVMRGAATRSAGTYSIEYVDLSDWFVGYPPDGDYMTGNWPSNTTAVSGTVVSLPPVIRGPHAVEKPFGEGYVIYTWEWYTVVPRGYTNTATDNILDVGSGTFVMPESDVIVMGRWVYNESIQIFPYGTEGGSVTWDGVNASYAQGTYATLTAVPDKGYYFVGWKLGNEDGPTGEIVSTNNPWRFQVTWDKRYTRYYAIFAVRPPGKIMVINGRADKYTAVEGDIITITANNPPAGDELTIRVFDKWTADSPSVRFADPNAPVTTFEMPGPDVTVMASYAAACEIIVETDPAGFEAYTSGGGVYRVGDTVTVTASTPEGYRFKAWNLSYGDFYNSTYSFTADNNRYVTACYEKIPTITVQESEGGTATADSTYIDAGKTVTLTAKPKGGYTFDHWEVVSGGVELDAPSSAETTFTANGNDVVIKPHFTKLDVVITLQQVTYKVVNGTWSDGTKEDKKEWVLSGFKPDEVPIGMIAGEGYTGGAWDDNPNDATITGATTFTYTFTSKPALMDVTGIVEWNDGDNEQGKRPEKITVHLKANDAELESQNVEESEYGVWTFSFDSLPALDSQGVIDYAITVDEIPEYTTKVEKEGSYGFRVINTLDSAVKPDYTVTFDANVPANASTTCTGSMDDQSFTYYEKKALSENGYFLPGYDFTGWYTKVDGTVMTYSDGELVGGLSDNGGTVTLYALWEPKRYQIIFHGGDIGGENIQEAEFDVNAILEPYSDANFGWLSDGKVLRGWVTTGYANFYSDGASFINLCGEPRSDGSLADVNLVAQWVENGQIVVTVTKDGVPQEELADYFKLVNKDGIEFSVPLTYGDGKYTFDTSQASQPGHGPEPLPEGEYELNFYVSNASLLCKDSTKINYKADSASNVVFSYHSLTVKHDHPQDVKLWSTVDGNVGFSPIGWLVPDGSVATIRITNLSPGYILDRYTVDEGSPIYEDSDLTKAELPIQLLDKTAVTIHIIARPTLTITPLPQKYTYNGQIQGEGDTVYEDPAEIAEKVSVEGLPEGDSVASIILDGQEDSVGDYEKLIASNVKVVNAAGNDVTGNYDINYQPGTLTIDPAKVTITVNSVSKMEGDIDPAFTGTVEGLFDEGDLGEIEFVRAGSDEAAGTYKGVLTATYTENKNYEVTVIPGDFTIEASDPVPAKTGTLTFDLGDGTLDGKTGSITIEANVGDTIKLPGAPIREGYTFQYWKGSRYAAGADYKVEGDHAFTAVWEENKVKTYTVTFDANGHGTAPDSQTIEEGKKASKPKDPTASGYTFGGWFTDKECKSVYSFDTAVTKDITLYAKWTKNSSTAGDTGGTSASTAGTSAAKTGDENNVGLWFMLMVASLLALVFIVSRRRFRNR